MSAHRKPQGSGLGGLATRSREAQEALAQDMEAAGITGLLDYLNYVEAQEGQEGVDRGLALLELARGKTTRATVECLLGTRKQ